MMKKGISLLLVLVMTLSLLAGCGSAGKPEETTENTTVAPETETSEAVPSDDVTVPNADSLAAVIDAIYEKNPVEIAVGTNVLNLEDTSEEGMWAIKNFTGLDNADLISEAVVSEAMIGSIPFSMALVKTKDAADSKTVAEAMKSGIDPRKWVCVEADDLKVAGFGDTVMLIMVGSDMDMPAQSFVDAFGQVCGTPDFVLE